MTDKGRWWRFELDDGRQVSLNLELDARELATELQAQSAGGYVYNEDVIIPVRRVVLVMIDPLKEEGADDSTDA